MYSGLQNFFSFFSVLSPLFRSFVVIVVPRTLQTIIRPATKNDSADQERQFQSVSFRYSTLPRLQIPAAFVEFPALYMHGFSAKKTRPSQVLRHRCRNQTSTAASLPRRQLSPIIREYTVVCPSTEQTTRTVGPAPRPALPTESPTQESFVYSRVPYIPHLPQLCEAESDLRSHQPGGKWHGCCSTFS
jgi:hypothetical protein